MLAIGRALLGNPRLLIMDEPSEGLAPTIVDMLVDTLRRLENEGLAILLVEQKLDVATSLASRQLVMVGGEIALETTAAAARGRRASSSDASSASSRSPTSDEIVGSNGVNGAPRDPCRPRRRADAQRFRLRGSSAPRPDLAFVTTRDGDYAIFEMNADGGGQQRLTDERGDDSSPRKLFFQIEPAWSPDAEKIAFASRRAGTFDIFVMNADGTGSQRVTTTDEDESHPTWSPDGRPHRVCAQPSRRHLRDERRRIRGSPNLGPRGGGVGAGVVARRRLDRLRAARGWHNGAELWLVRPDGSRPRADHIASRPKRHSGLVVRQQEARLRLECAGGPLYDLFVAHRRRERRTAPHPLRTGCVRAGVVTRRLVDRVHAERRDQHGRPRRAGRGAHRPRRQRLVPRLESAASADD